MGGGWSLGVLPLLPLMPFWLKKHPPTPCPLLPPTHSCMGFRFGGWPIDQGLRSSALALGRRG
eukprot:9699748-Lingulodinium_polyedra.AAC.1